MTTEILNVTSEESYIQSIQKAARALQQGGLVAFPTETVYGLAASADHPDALARLREIKGRDAGPFTVHLGAREEADQFLNRLRPSLRRLIERSWPGPLTIVFEVDEPGKTPIVNGRDPAFIERVFHHGSVGLRCVDSAASRHVFRESECVVLASSANRKGRPPPTTVDEVRAALEPALDPETDLILDGGPTQYAAASTIVRVRDHDIELLREGVLDERTVRKLARTRVLLVCTGNTCRSPMAEGLLRRLLAEALGCESDALVDRGYEVRSAGTFGSSGAPATPEAVNALQALGIDISRHRSTPLTPDMVLDSQVVLAMTRSHLMAAQSMAPAAAERCALLAGNTDIEDPIGGSAGTYETCRDQIQAALRQQLTECIL